MTSVCGYTRVYGQYTYIYISCKHILPPLFFLILLDQEKLVWHLIKCGEKKRQRAKSTSEISVWMAYRIRLPLTENTNKQKGNLGEERWFGGRQGILCIYRNRVIIAWNCRSEAAWR